VATVELSANSQTDVVWICAHVVHCVLLLPAVPVTRYAVASQLSNGAVEWDRVVSDPSSLPGESDTVKLWWFLSVRVL
jgi:hypothetical protein